MAPSKEDGAAAATAEQIGSMSLGRSGGRNDNEAENNKDGADKNETPTKNKCSACEKKSNALKKCRNCKYVLVLRQGMPEQTLEGA